jgi:uncharacterized protein YybS (DUF2232 family)
MALLGLLFPPAAWLSAAAVALVTLVKGGQNGVLTMMFSMIAALVLATLIFAQPLVAFVFAIVIWLPAWIAAVILRQTVSLALSLQALTALAMLFVFFVYLMFPAIGEYWRPLLDEIFHQFAQQSSEIDQGSLKQTEEWLIMYLPGLLISGVMFTTMVSLLLARWWQAVLYNPGGFAREFQGLNLGKISALVALAIMLASMFAESAVIGSLMTTVVMLYLVQGLSLMHAVINIKQLSGIILVVAYLLIFFIPHLVVVLFVAAVTDPWLDLRQRLLKQN